jgi:hypothetical protein
MCVPVAHQETVILEPRSFMRRSTSGLSTAGKASSARVNEDTASATRRRLGSAALVR